MRPLLRSILRPCSRAVTGLAARAYVAGTEVQDALEVCRRLSRRGVASTLGFMNLKGEAPRRVASTYLAAIDAAADGGLDCRVSIKLPPLAFDAALFGEVLQRAGERGVAVQVDAMAHEAAGATLDMAGSFAGRHPQLGVTLPGRWQRSPGDARAAADRRLRVRVVKGQWPDPGTPDLDPRAGFLAVIDALAGSASCVSVATHDVPLAREALARLQRAATPCEMELLFGLPLRPLVELARELRVPVRVYAPYGHAALPYELSARSAPKVLARGMRDLVLGRAMKATI